MLTRSGMRGQGTAPPRRRRRRPGRAGAAPRVGQPAGHGAARAKPIEGEKGSGDKGPDGLPGVFGRPGRRRAGRHRTGGPAMKPGLRRASGGDQSGLAAASGSIPPEILSPGRRFSAAQLEGRPRLQFERAWRPAESRPFGFFVPGQAGRFRRFVPVPASGPRTRTPQRPELLLLALPRARMRVRVGFSRVSARSRRSRRVARRCWVGLGARRGGVAKFGARRRGRASSTRLSRALKMEWHYRSAPCRHGCATVRGDRKTVPQIRGRRCASGFCPGQADPAFPGVGDGQGQARRRRADDFGGLLGEDARQRQLPPRRTWAQMAARVPAAGWRGYWPRRDHTPATGAAESA